MCSSDLKNLSNYISTKHISTFLKLGVLLVAGGLAINISYQYLPIMVINILIISSQILSVLIGYIFFKERLNPKQWLAIALIIISFFIVAISA